MRNGMPDICPHCGKVSPEESPRFCSGCGARMDGRQSPFYPGYTSPPVREQKNRMIAGICSCVLPGLGQVYNGEPAKGFAIFLIFLAGLVFLLIPGLIVWFFAIYDAYSVAGKMNTGEIQVRETRLLHMAAFIVFAAAVIIIAVLVIIALIATTLAEFESLGNGNINELFNPAGLF
jgi:TM2 domain-containing membrane protein YozV